MIPQDIKYTATHEWVKIDGDTATIGITDFAQEQLGDLTFVDLPALGKKVVAGKEMGSVESVKAASDLYSPVSGEVVAVNDDLANDPGAVNADPYGKGWMIRVKLEGAPQGLLSADDYAKVAVDGH